jgi:glycosyltransferase involved in cell wall biosynthesis
MVNMHRAKVSVIIPAYNSELYIADALRSILAQTYLPQEIIVVDDGSCDGTARALDPFLPAIRYIYQNNGGEPAARNTGMREAKGDYIAFLDADDLWVPEKLDLQMAYLAAHPEYAFVYSDMSTFDENGIVDRSVKARFNITFPTGNIFRALFHETLFGSGTVLFHRECLEKAGYFDEELLVGSDYEMWLRMAQHVEMGVVDKPLLLYRQHSTMSTRSLGRAMRGGVPWEVLALNKVLCSYPEASQQLGRSVVKRRLAKPYADLAHTWLQQRNHKNARKLFGRAIAYSPAEWQYSLFYLATFLPPARMEGLRRLYRKWLAVPKSEPDACSRRQATSQ